MLSLFIKIFGKGHWDFYWKSLLLTPLQIYTLRIYVSFLSLFDSTLPILQGLLGVITPTNIFYPSMSKPKDY